MQRIASLLLLLALGCRGPARYADERPGFVADRDLAPVVLLAGEPRGIGSGLVVGEDLVLTARHVSDSMLRVVDGRTVLRLGRRELNATLVAQGEGHADWALLRVEGAAWSPAERVALHPHLALGWRPAPGAELWLAGYATRMFPPEGIDPRLPARMVRCTAGASEHDRAGVWAARGRGLDLSGMSGGGVFLWSEQRQRLELVALHISHEENETRLDVALGVGLTLASTDRHVFQSLPPELLERLDPRD